MTIEQIRQVVELYDSRLYPAAAPVPEQEGGSRLQHVRWMCQQIPKMLDEGHLEKVNRWLGFIQGVLWLENIYTIDQMRNHNR